MTKTEEALADLAKKAIITTLHEGKKHHRQDDFSTRDPNFHLDRAIRHICTARLIRDKHQDMDLEGVAGHLGRALTRLAMAMHQENQSADK